MSNLSHTKIVYLLIAVVIVAVLFLLYKKKARQAKVSEFGKYQGYSEETYDGNQRTSDYLTLSDGRRLAYDLILPTKKGVPASEPLPVLFKYTPYLRTFTIFDKNSKNIIADLFSLGWKERAMLRIRYWLYERGHLMDSLFRTRWLKKMLKHGYAVVVVERPGTGASYGVPDMSFEPGAKEGNEILDWIASKPWCNGNIGMYGDSFQAMIQFAIASIGNPHLKAIFPVSSPLDNYDAVMYRGGVYNKAFASFFSWATSFLESVITPVDSDKDGALLTQARKERSGGTLGETSSVIFKRYPFRDSIMSDGTNLYENRASLYPFIERINRSGIPVYMTTGWYDLFTGDMFFWYNNLTIPKRLIVRPLDHSGIEENQFDLDFAAEAHRWFDRWLRGINNGIMDEPPIHYYVMGAPKKQAWQTCNQWPIEKQKLKRFYFGKGKTGSIISVNDGFLTIEAPTAQDAFDAYTVDYTTTSGKHSRWTAVNWPRDYPDMSSNDEKALTFTTSPLETDVEVTGHPVAHLWLSTDAPDLDVFVYLLEVDRKGRCTYITEGNLRASHRKRSQAPFKNMGLPYHSHYQSDVAQMPAGEPAELAFSLLPTSYRFHKGNRIRTTIVCADADNFDTPIIKPAPKLHLLRDMNHPSFIELPVAQSR
ncbi:MAG: CocE/NonD family hydrolase [Desulfobacterales bacterium]|nr:MAG: CocE/NonD family hydrolase [Desulfobacterales bacterium]